MNSEEFDLWADNYDKAVGLSDEDGTYPFAGYRALLGTIYSRVLGASSKCVLDIGFGTAALTSKLYEKGCLIYGQDFSTVMIGIAKGKMPNARLFQGDFSEGLAEPLLQQKYDAIIAAYSLHHLIDGQKIGFLRSLFPLLNEGGCIYIGDIAFETRSSLRACMEKTGDEWDPEEYYFVADELKRHFPSMRFEKISDCAGLITLQSGDYAV